jgi:hypothetical protein
MGQSEWSSPAHCKLHACAPPAPHNVRLAASAATSLTVQWDAPAVNAPAPVQCYIVHHRALQARAAHHSKEVPFGDAGPELPVAELHVASDSCSASHACLSPDSSPRRGVMSAPATSDGSCGTPDQQAEGCSGAPPSTPTASFGSASISRTSVCVNCMPSELYSTCF